MEHKLNVGREFGNELTFHVKRNSLRELTRTILVVALTVVAVLAISTSAIHGYRVGNFVALTITSLSLSPFIITVFAFYFGGRNTPGGEKDD